jgi:hypothetical protein
MKRLLVTLWVAGAALYTANSFILVRALDQGEDSSPTLTPAISISSLSVAPDTRRVIDREKSQVATEQAPVAAAPQDQVIPPTTQQQAPLPSTSPQDFATNQAVDSNPDALALVEVVRTAPVHSGPSVSAPTIGYLNANSKLAVLERGNGWARIRDQQTSQEGWVYEPPYLKEAHSLDVPSSEEPASGVEEASLETDDPTTEISRPKAKPHRNVRNHFRGRRFGRLGLFRRW